MIDDLPFGVEKQFEHRGFTVVKESYGWSYTHPDFDGEDKDDLRHGWATTPTGCMDQIDEYYREVAA